MDDDDRTNDSAINATDPIVRRAHKRFKRCSAWESTARQNWVSDYKFANGDEYNNYQWPINLYEDRGARPSLTVNETRTHNDHIINEATQNKASVKYRPTGGEATEQAAEVMEGLYRHISNISNAQMAQGQAIGFQIDAGMGWTIIEADYIEASPTPGPDAFNQEIYIRGVDDPMCVMLDSDAKERDGSDARFGFEFTDRPKDEVIEEYPALRNNVATANAVDGETAGWVTEDHVRECVYYEVSEDKDELLGDDDGTVVFASAVPKELRAQWEEEHEARGSKLKSRPIIRKSVKSHLIIGNDLMKTTDLPGTSVPIVPWYGRITVVDRILDRKGHTRSMISAQRMENYNWSASVEFGALQSKSPWVIPSAAVGDYVTYWSTANVENHSYLPFVHRDEEGRDIPPPVRAQPPTSAPVFMEGVALARQFMQSSSGQYEAMMGEQGNERSGKAINERQRMGDRATYHFVDAQALAIRRQGVIIKEWIPVIYDTKRVAKILGEDGTESEVQIDPSAPKAHQTSGVGDAIQRIFNPKLGSYEVVSDVGPDYATQRQEAFNAITEVLVRAPGLVEKIGDLLFRVADFPLADEMAERLKPGMPADAQKAIGDLQKQLQNQNKLLGEAMQSLAEERLKVKSRDANTDIDAYKADTDRLKALGPMLPMDPEGLRVLVHQAVREALANPLNGVEAAAAPDLATAAAGGVPQGAGMPSPQAVQGGNGAGMPGG